MCDTSKTYEIMIQLPKTSFYVSLWQEEQLIQLGLFLYKIFNSGTPCIS